MEVNNLMKIDEYEHEENKNLVNQRAIVGDASLPGMLQRVQSNHLRLIHRLMTVLQTAKALSWVTIYKAH